MFPGRFPPSRGVDQGPSFDICMNSTGHGCKNASSTKTIVANSLHSGTTKKTSTTENSTESIHTKKLEVRSKFDAIIKSANRKLGRNPEGIWTVEISTENLHLADCLLNQSFWSKKINEEHVGTIKMSHVHTKAYSNEKRRVILEILLKKALIRNQIFETSRVDDYLLNKNEAKFNLFKTAGEIEPALGHVSNVRKVLREEGFVDEKMRISSGTSTDKNRSTKKRSSTSGFCFKRRYIEQRKTVLKGENVNSTNQLKQTCAELAKALDTDIRELVASIS